MEEKINIAAILKDKLENTKLYSPLFGDVYFYYVKDDLIKVTHHGERIAIFFDNGRYYNYPESESLLFPSKEMRDWGKFAWKIGDVLVYRNSEEFYYTIFEGFQDDEYTQFKSRYCNNSENRWLQSKVGITDLFTKVSDEEAKRFIKKIEECYNGKLNLDTLEIEKTQPEFKNGDIVVTDAVPSLCYSKCIFILKGDLNTGESCANSYIFYNIDNNDFCFDVLDTEIRYRNIRLATEEEKKQLFSALEKEGKRWDSEKKEVVDLKSKCEFKPFDKVLGRNEKDDVWEAELFSHYKKESQYPFRCIGFSRKYCIPYNEETAHLLGTTDDWEGGEQ